MSGVIGADTDALALAAAKVAAAGQLAGQAPALPVGVTGEVGDAAAAFAARSRSAWAADAASATEIALAASGAVEEYRRANALVERLWS